MLSTAIIAAMGMVGIAMALNLWRLARGPAMSDRILALDTLTINAIAVVMLYGLQIGNTAYFEAALLMAMMGFIATAALCKFRLSGDVIE